MPPSLRHAAAPAAGFFSRSCTRCQSITISQPRQFSTTQKRTRLSLARQAMFQWLQGPGYAFKEPTPGRPNYLGKEEASEEDEGSKKNKKGRNNRDGTGEGADESTKQKAGNESLIAPFPGNRLFKSQPVLSEELKEEVWKTVTQKGLSVRRVSVIFNIDMRRVAAVVRLKEIEKQWEREVSHSIIIHTHDEIQQNRLVLKTPTWLKCLIL
jgi:hypothetical protein